MRHCIVTYFRFDLLFNRVLASPTLKYTDDSGLNSIVNDWKFHRQFSIKLSLLIFRGISHVMTVAVKDCRFQVDVILQAHAVLVNMSTC